MVVNARHMKAVPGRKTDVQDAEWITDLLQHGLLQPNYIPDKAQRELREPADDLNGVMTPLQRKIKKVLRSHIDELDRHITEFDDEIDRNMKDDKKRACSAIRTSPGAQRRVPGPSSP